MRFLKNIKRQPTACVQINKSVRAFFAVKLCNVYLSNGILRTIRVYKLDMQVAFEFKCIAVNTVKLC